MKTVKNLQTQLKSDLKLDKSIPSSELKTYLAEINLNVNGLIDNLSDEEYNQAYNHITKKFMQISTVEPESDDNSVVDESLAPKQDDVETVTEITTVNDDSLAPKPEELEPTSNPELQLAKSESNNQVKGMVNYKASEMGISLAASEVDVIASQVDNSANNFTETLNKIESALIAYINYQGSQEANQIDLMFNRVTQKVVDKNQSTLSRFSSGVTTFKSTLEAEEQQQKSELKSILSRLKAG